MKGGNGGDCDGTKSKLYAKVITLPGFYTAFWVAFSTAVDISDDEGGMQ